jgi:hypothetical protein
MTYLVRICAPRSLILCCLLRKCPPISQYVLPSPAEPKPDIGILHCFPLAPIRQVATVWAHRPFDCFSMLQIISPCVLSETVRRLQATYAAVVYLAYLAYQTMDPPMARSTNPAH